jgi:D-amino-acid oxidase
VADVGVVGGGVVGLTAALRLAQAGHRVRCVRDVPVSETVSALAGGLWFPYHVDPRDRVVTWGSAGLRTLTDLAEDPTTGVLLRQGVVTERAAADRWWLEGIPAWRDSTAAELPAGATGGVTVRLPVVTMPIHLRWLEARCSAAGVDLVEEHVARLGDVPGDVVVVAAGLRSPSLVPGAVVGPSRGQIALLENPGLDRWLVDDGNPAGLTYVLPHPGWVVCGGTDVEGATDDRPDPRVHDEIVERCREAVPALRAAAVLGARVGLRPVAPAVSLALRVVGGRPVVTDFGHGGAGVTLAWGCADEVVELVGGLG